MRGWELALPACPATSTQPASYDSIPARMFSRVDFPQPDGPTMLTNSPGSTVRLIESRTVKLRSPPGAKKSFRKFRTAMADGDGGRAGGSCCKLRSPRKDAARPYPEYQKIDRDHDQHEAHAPGEHHVDARILEPVDQLLSDAVAGPERLGHQRDLPGQRQGYAQG